MKCIYFFCLQLLLVLLFLSVSAKQPPRETKLVLQERMKARFMAVQKLKHEHHIGETSVGFIEPLTMHAETTASIMRVISEENSDRKKLYRHIAQDIGIGKEVVGKANALRIFDNAEETVHFKVADSLWFQKKDIETELYR